MKGVSLRNRGTVERDEGGNCNLTVDCVAQARSALFHKLYSMLSIVLSSVLGTPVLSVSVYEHSTG